MTRHARVGLVFALFFSIGSPVAAALEARLEVIPSGVCAGQGFLVTLTVTNSGVNDVNGVNVPPLPFEVMGTGGVTLSDGPEPALPITLAGGGGAQTFTWTFTGASSGAVALTTTVEGVDAITFAVVSSGPATSGAIVIAAPGALAGLGAVIPQALVGQWFNVTLTITNAGGAAVDVITPAAIVGPGPGLVTLASGPVPAAVATLAAGSATTLTWTYSASGAGLVGLSLSVTGVTCNGMTVFASGTVSTTIMGQARLTIASLRAAPGLAAVNALITVVMTVSNTGSADALNVQPTFMTPAGIGKIALVSGPAGPVALMNPGESVAFIWTYRAVRGGEVTFSGGATANGVPPPAPRSSNLVFITDGGADLKHMQVYPTPFRSDQAVGGTLKFRRMPAGTRVKIYDATGELVRELQADAYGYAEWNARNTAGRRAASGVYFFAAVTPGGEKKLGKVEVVH